MVDPCSKLIRVKSRLDPSGSDPSGSGDEVSYEDDNLKHGIFSYFVLKGLKDMEADRNKDFRVTVHELGNYVKNEVQDWCKYNRKSPTQTPSLAYKDTSGDIELVNKK